MSKNKTDILVNKEIRQVGALCFQIIPKENPKVLLITSRRSQRWIIPKGWPIKGLKSYKVAEQEAFEEAGASGTAFDFCLGSYSYIKKLDQGPILFSKKYKLSNKKSYNVICILLSVIITFHQFGYL